MVDLAKMITVANTAMAKIRSSSTYFLAAEKSKHRRSRSFYNYACRLRDDGTAKMKELCTVAGRMRKKLKAKKKYYKVVTLTAINNIPWCRLVKK